MSLLRAIVLFALIACTLAQDPVCKAPAGQVDSFQTDMCNCWSGYAPSTPDSLDCSAHPKCAPNMADDVSEVQSNAPLRPDTEFKADMLEIFQKVPIVANRKATNVRFYIPKGMGDSTQMNLQTCGYPGPLWNKIVNGRDCIDEYRASMPWSQHGACGFARDVARSINDTEVFSSNMVTMVVDTYKNGKEVFQRTSSTSYLISVSFKIRKTVTLFTDQTFSVSIPDPSNPSDAVLTKSTISNTAYEPASGETVVTIITTTLWPYQINPNAAALAGAFTGVLPNNPLIEVEFKNEADASLACSNKPRSTCTQKFTARISSSGECISNLKGAYSFTAPLICRDTAGAPAECPTGLSTADFKLNVQKTDLCDGNAVDASAENSFRLSSFSDAAHSISAEQYQTGDTVYWSVEAKNKFTSIKSLTINTIKIGLVGAEGVEDILYTKTDGVSSRGTAVHLTKQELEGSIPAGQSGFISFQYDLLRAQLPSTLGTLQASNTQVQLSTSIIVDIEYYGNTKRSIEMDLSEMQVASAAHDIKAIRVVAPELMNSAPASAEAVKADESSASVLSAMSIALFALFARLLF